MKNEFLYFSMVLQRIEFLLSGADNVANDGVYSAYFIAQTGNGYYSLMV